MNRIFSLVSLLGIVGMYSINVYGEIEIAGVEAKQIEGESQVSIEYDIGNSEHVPTIVSLEVSSNGEYWTESDFVTGDVGSGVTQGFNKKMIWDAGSEWPSELFISVRVRVRVIQEPDSTPISG